MNTPPTRPVTPPTPATDSAPGPALVLFGGTFDPVHRAHISCARAASRALAHSPVHMLPNAVPPHRPQPVATGAQRMHMLALACAPYPALVPDDWELKQASTSYSLLTLQHFRQQIGPHRPLVFVIGADSFSALHHWHDWQRYAALCHLLVLPRPGSAPPRPDVSAHFPIADAATLLDTPCGYALLLNRPVLDVSSTAVRAALRQGRHCPALDPDVEHYIQRHRLYNN